MFYKYRITEEQLDKHLGLIAEAGDHVEAVVYKGGRDYVLIVRKAETVDLVGALQKLDSTLNQLADAVERGVRKGIGGLDAYRTRVSR